MNSFIKIANNVPKLNFKDVNIIPVRSNVSSRANVNLHVNLDFDLKKRRQGWCGIPIISSNMDTVTNLNTFDVLSNYNYLSCFPKYFNEYWLNELKIPDQLTKTEHYMLSAGINDYVYALQLIQRLKREFDINVKFLCIDTPNGYLTELQDITLTIREHFPDLIIVAGNVVTPEITYDLIKYSGVNIIKCGIGSGGACETSKKTGVGYPQLSAVLECSAAAHEAGGYLISDGGITDIGDIAKAFSAGADFVMCGSLFSGHDESPGDICTLDGKELKSFYGMSSKKANDLYSGGLKDYRTAEGAELYIPLKGSLKNTIRDINGGLRSACTYVNAEDLTDFYLNSRLVKIN